MILDIVQVTDGKDLGLAQSSLPKAANVLAVQVGELEYAPPFGVDKKYFLTSPFNFQKESYRAHVIQRLAENQVNVVDILELMESLNVRYKYTIATENEKVRGLIK